MLVETFDPMTGCDFSASSDGRSCTRSTTKTLGKVLGTMRQFKYGKPPWILQPRTPADCPDCT